METKRDNHAITVLYRDHEITQLFDCPQWEVRAAQDDCVMFTSITVKGCMEAIDEVMDDMEAAASAEPPLREIGGLRCGGLHAIFETDDHPGMLKIRATIYRADQELDCLWHGTLDRAKRWAQERMEKLT